MTLQKMRNEVVPSYKRMPLPAKNQIADLGSFLATTAGQFAGVETCVTRVAFLQRRGGECAI